MGAEGSYINKSSQISQVVFKLPYFNPLFQESEILLRWPFSKTILVTAFDLFRDDGLLTRLQKSGLSLRDYLQEFGFNPEIKILADTGVFEMEMRKSRISKLTKHLSDEIHLNTKEIFHAYDIIDPDYLVAPDEMILLDDTVEIQQKKKQTILDNLDETLSRFHRDRVIATMQGLDNQIINEIADRIRDEEITKIARGGLLPLRKQSRKKFHEILKTTENIVRDKNIDHIHAFGLSHISVLSNYFSDNSYDSVDTSAVYYYTADRKYLTNYRKFVQVRRANFDQCQCEGCEIMQDNLNYADRNTQFIIGLYAHNAYQTSKLAMELQNEKKAPNGNIKSQSYHRYNYQKKSKPYKRFTWSDRSIETDTFMSALELDSKQKSIFKESKIHNVRTPFIEQMQANTDMSNKSILVISSCSKRKTTYTDITSVDLNCKKKRKKILKNKNYSKTIAVELYDGYQNKEIKRAISDLQSRFSIDHLIISAGWGLLQENEEVVSYDATFQNLSNEEIIEISENLEIPKKLRQFVKKKFYSLIYIAVGPPYLIALGDLDFLKQHTDEVVLFSPLDEFEDNLASELTYYTIEEFWKLEKQNTSIIRIPFGLGQRYKARGTILRNFAHYLMKYPTNSTSFIKWWHLLYDCGCHKEKMSYNLIMR